MQPIVVCSATRYTAGDPRTMAVAARTVETMWSLGGAASGTPSLPVARESEPEKQETSPAVIDMFKSAIEYLLGLGEQLEGYQIIRLEETPKAVETTARKDGDIETEQALLEHKENKMLVQKK
jgi:hypothetical protein